MGEEEEERLPRLWLRVWGTMDGRVVVGWRAALLVSIGGRGSCRAEGPRGKPSVGMSSSEEAEERRAGGWGRRVGERMATGERPLGREVVSRCVEEGWREWAPVCPRRGLWVEGRAVVWVGLREGESWRGGGPLGPQVGAWGGRM
jgi:hypothetical protein